MFASPEDVRLILVGISVFVRLNEVNTNQGNIYADFYGSRGL
jgi:hypothetical protein